ncbi:unnamed protein product [Effrenium voratum]|uniref:Uncharacterized protein n=1 Tax=Effrenium voratum TaxID=2562239 RepID=A0AA36ISS2_9DINO|nr:unnamed protein product [Effrenium voratum]CAJ1425805.1 unnamed protein product [Effrenium voratum]
MNHGANGAYANAEQKIVTQLVACASPWNVVGPGMEFERMEDFFAPPLENWGGPYSAMLDFLLQQGWLQGLPLDLRKLLLVSVPFCGGFMECPALPQFLTEKWLPASQAAGASILGTDERSVGAWAAKERFVARKFPKLALQLRAADLMALQLPKCSVSLGVHPEATRKGWAEIISNVVSSLLPGGVCVFATYFDIEAAEVRKVAASKGLRLETFENPYYQARPMPASPSMRYILVGRV